MHKVPFIAFLLLSPVLSAELSLLEIVKQKTNQAVAASSNIDLFELTDLASHMSKLSSNISQLSNNELASICTKLDEQFETEFFTTYRKEFINQEAEKMKRVSAKLSDSRSHKLLKNLHKRYPETFKFNLVAFLEDEPVKNIFIMYVLLMQAQYPHVGGIIETIGFELTTGENLTSGFTGHLYTRPSSE